MTVLWIACIPVLLPARGTAQESEFIRSNEETIHLRTWGEGRPILVINGGPGFSSEGFEAFAEPLSRFGRVILHDQRGTGRSTLPVVDGTTVTIARMVDDIETIRAHLGYDTWTVIGHSFGGMLASAYTARYPERVSGLVLSSSGGIDNELFGRLNVSGRLSRSRRDSLRMWTRRIAAGDTTRSARYRRNLLLARAYVADTTHVPAVARRLMLFNRRVNRLVVADMRRIGFDVSRELAEFDRPVLIVHGEEDIVPVDIARKAHGTFPNSRLVVVTDAGHFAWLERPEAYFGAVGRFFHREL